MTLYKGCGSVLHRGVFSCKNVVKIFDKQVSIHILVINFQCVLHLDFSMCVQHVCLYFKNWFIIKKWLNVNISCYSLLTDLNWKYSCFMSENTRFFSDSDWLTLFFAGVDGLSHLSPVLPTDSNFDTLFQQSTSFVFVAEENGGKVSTSEVPVFAGYQVCFCFKAVIIRLWSI